MRCSEHAEYVCDQGPGYNLFSGKFKPGANSHTYPYDKQSDSYSALNGATENATATVMFTPDRTPVHTAIAKEFGGQQRRPLLLLLPDTMAWLIAHSSC